MKRISTKMRMSEYEYERLTDLRLIYDEKKRGFGAVSSAEITGGKKEWSRSASEID